MADETGNLSAREELIAARDRVKRQIEILEIGPIRAQDRTPETPRLIAELRTILAEINAEIADLGSSETGSESATKRTSPFSPGYRSWWRWKDS